LLAGQRTETLRFGEAASVHATQLKARMIRPGVSYFDRYDKPQFVTPVVNRLARLVGRNPWNSSANEVRDALEPVCTR